MHQRVYITCILHSLLILLFNWTVIAFTVVLLKPNRHSLNFSTTTRTKKKDKNCLNKLQDMMYRLPYQPLIEAISHSLHSSIAHWRPGCGRHPHSFRHNRNERKCPFTRRPLVRKLANHSNIKSVSWYALYALLKFLRNLRFYDHQGRH